MPSECLGDFFGAAVADILYTTNEYGYDFAELSFLPDSEIINAFAESVGSDYRCDEETAISYNTFDEYETHRISMVFYQLLHHKNVIIEGVSGTGKSYVVNKIAQNELIGKKRVDIVIGSPPCQTFSSLSQGKTKSLGKDIKHDIRKCLIC